jgi:hypothetical protein
MLSSPMIKHKGRHQESKDPGKKSKGLGVRTGRLGFKSLVQFATICYSERIRCLMVHTSTREDFYILLDVVK